MVLCWACTKITLYSFNVQSCIPAKFWSLIGITDTNNVAHLEIWILVFCPSNFEKKNEFFLLLAMLFANCFLLECWSSLANPAKFETHKFCGRSLFCLTVLYNHSVLFLFYNPSSLHKNKTLMLLSFLGGGNLAQICFGQTLYTGFVLSNWRLKALCWIIHPATHWTPVSKRNMNPDKTKKVFAT